MTKTQLPERTSHLKRLSHSTNNLKLPTTNGNRTFVSEKHLFPGHFSKDFETLGTDDAQVAITPEIIPVVYEQTEDGNFQTVIGSIWNTMNPFWASQDPVIRFIETAQSLLHPIHATFFPIIVGDRRFVADVRWDHGKLAAHIFPFDLELVWEASYRRRYVFPESA
jgi:hypothetical protein